MLAKQDNPPPTADQQSEPIVIDDDEDEIQIESVESMEVCANSVPRKGTKPRKRLIIRMMMNQMKCRSLYQEKDQDLLLHGLLVQDLLV